MRPLRSLPSSPRPLARRLRWLVAGLDAAWPVADVVKQQNIEYGAAYNNYTRQEQRLTLDLYSPPASDRRTKRPAFGEHDRFANGSFHWTAFINPTCVQS